MTLEKIVKTMKEKQKSQRTFDSIDEPVYYSCLLNNSSNKDNLEKLGVEIKIFEKTSEY